MTKAEIRTIENIIARLKSPNLGCGHMPGIVERIAELNALPSGDERGAGQRLEVASRVYLDTWLIGALECLLPGEGRDPGLACRLSGK